MLTIYGEKFESRFLLGTSLYPSLQDMLASIKAAKTNIVTVSLRRQNAGNTADNRFWTMVKQTGCRLLPNTAGCESVQEAVTTAQMARELFQTDWIKLEVIANDYTLEPNPFALVEATEQLLKLGFKVLPYCTSEPVLCEKLVNLGCQVLMPLAAPIGTGIGIRYRDELLALRHKYPQVTLIVDAGIGAPSHATESLELGYDGVLLNSAVALAQDPTGMANAFRLSIEAGRLAYESGIMPKRSVAQASTPTVGKPFWHEEVVVG